MGLDPAAYELDAGLVEIGFGAWEGFTLEEMARTAPDAVAAREADKWNFVPPGGESYAMLAARIGRWLDAVAEDCVVVAHGAVGRVLRGHLFDLDRRDVPLLPAPQDEVLICRPDGGHWLRQPSPETASAAPGFRLVPHLSGG
jgi:probable phosphoglycerate mutase